MINLKPKVLETLKTIKGVSVFFYYPDKFKNLPCISYYEIANKPYKVADDMEYFSMVEFVVDIWAKTSAETSDITIDVDEKMNKIGFCRVFSYDVSSRESDEKKTIIHKTMRFKYIGG